MRDRHLIVMRHERHAVSRVPLDTRRLLSLLLALALLSQGAVLLAHSHLQHASASSVAAADASHHGPADHDAADCDLCETLSQCRAAAVSPSSEASRAAVCPEHRLALASATAPREPAPTGTGARSPPSSLV